MKGDMTKGAIFSKLIVFAMPIMLGNLFTQFYNAADSLIVGRFLGSDALAAVGACFSIQQVFYAIMGGMGMGATVICAQFFGAGKIPKVKDGMSTAMYIAMIVGAGLTVFGTVFARPVLQLLNTPEEILDQAVIYLVVVSVGNIPHLYYNMGAAIMRGLGNSRTPFYYLIFCSLLNIGLDLLFVAVFGFGVAGAAWATMISQAISAILVMRRCTHFNEQITLKRQEIRFVGSDAKSIVKIGTPVAVQNLVVALGSVILQVFINHFGTDCVAAGSLVIKVDGFIVLPMMALNQTMLSFTGQNIGAWKLDRIRKGLLEMDAFAAAIGLGLGTLLWFAGGFFVGLFTTNEAVIAAGASALRVLAFFYWAMAMEHCYIGTIGGTGKTGILIVLSVVQVLLRIPVSYYFGVRLEDFNGLYIGNIVANLIGFVIPAIFYHSGVWKKSLKRIE